MAEREGQAHDSECADATGKTCICACRGRFHGIQARNNRTARLLARVGEVAATARAAAKPSAPASTPAERARNPVKIDKEAAVAAATGAAAPAPGPTPPASQAPAAPTTSARQAGQAGQAGTRWIDRQTGRDIATPSQVDIVRGNVVPADSDAGRATLAARQSAAVPETPLARKEAELTAAREALAAYSPQFSGNQRTKSANQRVGATFRRSAQLVENVQRLEREVEGLRRQGDRPAPAGPPPGGFNAGNLAGAKFVRTRLGGWYEVVKVNRASVKVKAAPGMDDTISHKKIIDARGADQKPLTPAAPTPAAAKPPAPEPAPAADKPEPPTAPPASTAGPLAGFSPADQQRVRNAVADRGPEIFTSPMVGGSRTDVARYLAEAEGPTSLIRSLEGQHDWRTVWKAVAQVLDENPELVEGRSPAKAKADREDRTARVQGIVDQAEKALKAEDLPRVAELLDAAYAIDPDHRLPGRLGTGPRLAEIRDTVHKQLAEKHQHGADTPATPPAPTANPANGLDVDEDRAALAGRVLAKTEGITGVPDGSTRYRVRKARVGAQIVDVFDDRGSKIGTLSNEAGTWRAQTADGRSSSTAPSMGQADEQLTRAAARGVNPPAPPAPVERARPRPAREAAATELTIDGAETAYVPGDRATLGIADRPQVGRATGPATQQLGMFDVSDQRQMEGQEGLLDAMAFGPGGAPSAPQADVYDRPAVTASQVARQADVDGPAIPADLATMSDADLEAAFARVIEPDERGNIDQPLAERLGDELDRRDAAARRREVIDSVPDTAGLASMGEDDVTDLLVRLTSVTDLEPDAAAALARIEADLDRRTADERREREAPLREFLARDVTAMSEDDLEIAARHASTLGDESAIVRIFTEWDRRDREEAARVEREREQEAAAKRAQAEAAKQRAAQKAAAAAAKEAAQDRLADEMRSWSTDQLGETLRAGFLSPDEDLRIRTGLASQELARRTNERQAAEKARQEAEADRRAWREAPVLDLSDAQLAGGISSYEAPLPEWAGPPSRTHRERLADLRAELSRREKRKDERRALLAAAPTEPARVINPVAKINTIDQYSDPRYRTDLGAQAARERLNQSRRRALGLSDDADEKEVKAAAKADPRSVPEQAAMTLAWYQHLAKLDESIATDRARGVTPHPWLVGWVDEKPAPPMRHTQPPANVAKAWDVWQEIRDQARTDIQADNRGTYARYVMAMARAYGLPDDAPEFEIGEAFRADSSTNAQKAARFIGEYRELARGAGVKPDDRLRFGPPDRGGAKPKTRAGFVNSTTPEQEREIDRLVARGYEYGDAYAQVHNLDADTLRRQQAGDALAGGSRGGTAAALKKAYAERVHLQWLDAERETRGHLLNAAGRAAGIDPASLFSGGLPRARKYASEELLRYWQANPRMTFAEFQGNVTGKARQARERARAAGGAQGKDFAA
jgi:hypothetical protein